MAISFLDGDDCLDVGVGRALVSVEDVEMLEEMTELDDLVASAGDIEVEPLIPASGLNRYPNVRSVKIDALQQLL